jgi:hypothetical protein
VYLLQVEVVPTPFIIDQTFYFDHPENEFLKKRILVDCSRSTHTRPEHSDLSAAERRPPVVGGLRSVVQYKTLRCSDNTVVLTSSPHDIDANVQEIKLKYRIGRAGQTSSFYILLYNDQHQASL